MKVVINACYGGFSLSPRATKAYAAKKGRKCYFFVGGGSKPYEKVAMSAIDGLFWSAFDVPEARVFGEWRTQTQAQREADNDWYEAHSIDTRPSDRSDPDLVAVVENLGSAANGSCANLQVIEIPDGVEWNIEEYDGSEWVTENHRRWP